VSLYHNLLAADLPGTPHPLCTHFNIGPPDSQIITFSNRSNLKSVKHEVIMDNNMSNDRIFISPIQEITDITDKPISTSNPSAKVIIDPLPPRVSEELIHLISNPNTST